MGFPNPQVTLTPTQVAQIIAAVPSTAQIAAAVPTIGAITAAVPTPTQIVGAASAGAVPNAAAVGTQVNTNVKTRRVVTLLSGSSWTVPVGCLYVNAKLLGGAGGGGEGSDGRPGQITETTVTTTPGASISYAIGAGDTTGAIAGGDTTFTGALTAVGGQQPNSTNGWGAGTPGFSGSNGGYGGYTGSGNRNANGGQGAIMLEFWV